MSRKCNCKHPLRARSHYPERLVKRGLAKPPALESLENLRTRQDRRVRETCTLDSAHASHACNGHPWRVSSGDDYDLAA